MDTAEVMRWLQHGRRQGARHLWLSGGEPTLRRDFLQTLRAARHLGYERIKVQTNGMLFAYPGFADRALLAGMNEVNLLLKSLDAKVHDALNRTPGSHALLNKGLDTLQQADGKDAMPGRRPVRIEGDVLMTTRNVHELPQLVRHYAGRGVKHFNFWLFSLVDQGDVDLRRLVPSLRDAMPRMVEAMAIARSLGATVCSLNTPHCTVPPSAWEMLFDAAGMQLLVVNPGGHAFALETSTIEHGVYIESCATCAVRPHCHGMRSDYLDVHGSDELKPLTAAEVAGYDPHGSILDIAPVAAFAT